MAQSKQQEQHSCFRCRESQYNLDFQLPTISEVSRVLSAVQQSRSVGMVPKRSLSCNPRATPKTFRLDNPPQRIQSENPHFSCILGNSLKKDDGFQRVALSGTHHFDRKLKRSALALRARTAPSEKGRARTAPPERGRPSDYSSYLSFGREKTRAKFEKAAATVVDKEIHPEISTRHSLAVALGDVPTQLDPSGPCYTEAEPQEAIETGKVTHLKKEEEKSISMKLIQLSCEPSDLELPETIGKELELLKRISVKTFYKSFSVKTFCENGSRHVWINIQMSDSEDSIIVGEIKAKVCSELGIESSSMALFGLFQGTLHNPTCLLAEDEPVPYGDFCFCLMRAFFNPADESYILRSDSNATNLIYWELYAKLNSSYVFPPPSEEVSGKLDIVSSEVDSAPSHKNKNTFLKIYWDLEFFQSFYYNKDECYLKDTKMVEQWGIRKDSELIVAINFTSISIVDKMNECLLQSWSWNRVRALTMIKAETNRFYIEANCDNGDKEYITRVSLTTVHNRYLYSLGAHVINLHRKKHEGRPEDKEAVTEYTNRIFNRVGNLNNRRKNKSKKVLVQLTVDSSENFNDPVSDDPISNEPVSDEIGSEIDD